MSKIGPAMRQQASKQPQCKLAPNHSRNEFQRFVSGPLGVPGAHLPSWRAADVQVVPPEPSVRTRSYPILTATFTVFTAL